MAAFRRMVPGLSANTSASREVLRREISLVASLLRQCSCVVLWFFVFSVACSVEVINGIGTVGKLCGLIAFALGFCAVLSTGHYRRLTLVHVFMAWFVFQEAITCFWSMDPFATVETSITFVQLLGSAWLVWELTDSQQRLKNLLNALVIGTIVPSLYTIANYSTNRQFAWERYSGAGFDVNDLGVLLAISIVWSIHLMSRAAKWTALLYWAQIGVVSFTILLTASRTATIAALVALAYIPFSSGQVIARKAVAYAVVAVALVGVLWISAPASSRIRLLSIVPEVVNGDLSGRTPVWKSGLKQFESHTFVGVGAGAFGKSVQESMKDEFVAHNTFLSVLVEGGIGCLCAFGSLCVLLLRWVLRMPSEQRNLWLFTVAVWMVGASTLTLEHHKITWLVFSLITAQAGILRKYKDCEHHSRVSDLVHHPAFVGARG
jgi:O-antigen ligase